MIIARLPWLLAAVSTAAGFAAWLFYLHNGLVLSHYDAKAHLVVARRVLDSITPGWQQIGAVWLPLPHLLQALPVQVDLFYQTGAFASLLSIACLGVTAWAAARLILAMTGSRDGAIAATALLVLNPNLLYLHATPMTEPLLIAVTFLCAWWAYEWVEAGHERVPAKLGWAVAAAAWTRYEAWAVLGALIPLAAVALLRRGVAPADVARRILRLSAWPAIAVLLFLINSRITVGSWFVAGGFYVADVEYQDRPLRSILAVWWGTHQLSGYVIETVALLTAAAIALRAVLRRAEAPALVAVSVFAAGALPFYAFVQGHPFRIRYMIPMVAACALFGGLGVGLAGRRVRWAAPLLALILVGSSIVESPPWDAYAPMLAEAQWDVPASRNRRAVTDCLAPRGADGRLRRARGKIVASMGSLAHYMQELSARRFDIRDFVHEGNGIIWELVMKTGPAPHADWMLVEEQAEGGDILAQRIRDDAAFARGMERVCEGGGVALYRKVAE